MRYTVPAFFLFLLAGCESRSFDKDKRQIAAKEAVRAMLPPASHQFEITGFREDTLTEWNTVLKNPLRYTLDFFYKDSTEAVHQQTGSVIFTPDGNSIIDTQIAISHQ